MKRLAILTATVTLFALVIVGASAQSPGTKEGIDFKRDILPLFNSEHAWFEGSLACTTCHFSNLEKSMAELDMTGYEAVMIGADRLSEPEPEKIVTPGDWDESVLRRRMRNTRMPPGAMMILDESNRNGPCLEGSAGTLKVQKTPAGDFVYGKCDATAVGLIGAWVTAGAKESEPFTYGSLSGLTFAKDIEPFLVLEDMWRAGSKNCDYCHSGNDAKSAAEMDLTSYAGLMRGAEVLSEPPGEAIVTPGDWDHSLLRLRLRNNRMPPGWAFDDKGANRNGPLVKHPVTGEQVTAVQLLQEWVNTGANEKPLPD